jgi:hypothetical protein
VSRAAAGLTVVALLALSFASIATLGNDLLPPMLQRDQYSSAFNIGRYGQWAITAIAAVVLWRHRHRSVLDLWLLVMLCDSFFEIALVSIFNAGRYDVGFYAGRVYAVLASCVVLVMLLIEHGKMYVTWRRRRKPPARRLPCVKAAKSCAWPCTVAAWPPGRAISGRRGRGGHRRWRT